MDTKRVGMMALIATLGVAACGEDDTLGPNDLSQAEAAELAGAIAQVTLTSSLAPPAQPAQTDGPAMTPYEYESDVETVAQCPLGGEVALIGSVDASGDDETGEGRFEWSTTQTHNGCTVRGEGQTDFILDGNPSVTASFVVETDGDGVVEWDGSFEGGIDWSTEGREGTCVVDYEFSGSFSEQAETFSVSAAGSVCGHSVSQQFTVGG